MAEDIQSNIRINVDTASAMDSIRLLQNQISAFHTQMSKMGAANVADSRNLQQNLINSINSTGAFAANMTKVKTTAEQFTSSLEKNKLSMGEYFRYAGGATKSFGRLFKSEFETINKVARERVKDLQTQYIKLGRDANGAMQAIRVRPLTLDMNNLATKTQIAAQKQQLLNQLLKQGSTNLLNFGKNTQWAGRQLMVGFTIPLSIMGGAAMKAYKEIEEAGIRLKRVYGDLGTTNVETEKMVKEVQKLAQEYTKYGVAVKDSMDMAATAAATGKKGADLLAQVASSARLAVLGGVDQQMALKTTISLTDAFGVSTKQLSKDINFLNAVENQTVLSIEDMTIAIPKAAPVIQQLGGDVKDLAFFLTAMKEGGINASESANALKSGLASLINPTNTASKMLQGFGINLREIVQGNKGDVKKTVVDFAKALDTLDPLNRAKAIEQLFGKFQFARMSTLFKNVIEQGSQASEVLKLTSATNLQLSMLAQKELSKIEQSPLYKFQKSIADFQAQLAPVGEQFMKALTPVINFGTDVLKSFNNLNDGVKGFIVKFVAVAGVIGPVLLMSFGLVANAVANVIKGFALMKDIFNKTGKSSLSLGEQVNYMTQEQIQAAAIASSLDQVHSKLKQTFTSEAAAVDMLTKAYERSVIAQRGFAVPVTPRGPVAPVPARKYATGGFITGPGTGTSDSIPAMLSNGEAVIPARSVSKNKDLVQSLINNSLPRFATGGIIGTPSKSLMQQVKGTSAVIAYGAHQPFTTAHQGIAQMGMSMAEQSGIPFFQFTSNQGKAKRSVLGDDLKSRMISEAIGRNPEFAKNPFELMAILSKAGIKDVNILLGEDRMKSPVWEAAAKEFGITITKTGITRPAGSTSGTMTRAAAASGNFGMFESLLASGMSKSTKNEIFKNLFAAGNAKVRKFSNGGMISGPGTGTSDSILARVSNGEAIIPARSVARNPGMVRQLISGNIPGFNQGFIDEISGKGRNASAQTNISAILSSEIDKIRNRSKMYGYDADKVVGEFISHIRNSSENIDKLTQANIKAMVRNNPERITYSPNSGQQQTTQFTHVGGNASMTAQEALANLNLAPSKRANLEMVASANPSQPVNVYHGFGFQAKGSINEQMAKAGADLSEMVDDFGSRGVDKWRDAVKNGGGNFEQLISQATAYDKEVLLRLQQSKAQGVTKIVDTQLQIDNLRQKALAAGKTFDSKQYVVMEEIHNSVVTDLKMMGTELDSVFNSARQTIKDVRYRIPASMHGIPGIFEGTGRGPEKPNVRVVGGNYGTMPTPSQSTALGQANGLAFVNAQNAVLDNPANDPAMVSRDAKRRNSPHDQVPIDGRDDGVAYSQAKESAIAKEEAKAAIKRNRRVTSQGPFITPGESQAQQVQRTRGNRVASQGESFIPGSMIIVNPKDVVPAENTSSSPTIIPANQNFKKSVIPAPYDTSKMNFLEKQGLKLKYGQGFQGKMFGTSMGLGMASMFLPPELGAIAQAGSMATGVAGMFKDAGPKLGETLFKFGKPFTRLIPYVGAAVVAFEVFDKAILPMIRKNADAYNAISESLNLTQEKIDKTNNFFGTEGKLTGLSTATVGLAGQNKKEATIAEQFRASEDFKSTYQETANKLKNLSDREVQRTMQGLGEQLVGSGFGVDAAQAIVEAILLESGKKDVKIDFASFELGKKTKDNIDKDLSTTFNLYKNNFEDTGNFFGLFDFNPEAVAKTEAAIAQIAASLNAVSGQFELGIISGKEFNTTFDAIARNFYRLETSNSGDGVALIDEALKKINPTLALASEGVTNFTSKINILKAASAGLALNGDIINTLENGTTAEMAKQNAAITTAINRRLLITKEMDKQRKILTVISSSAKDINKLEEKINEKYNKRISQIEKIKKLNDQITNSQKSQLDLAQALNRGDIGAAAAAAIEIQNTDIQNALEQQTVGLDEARQLELEPLKGKKDAIDSAVDGINEILDKLQTKLEDIKIEVVVSDGKGNKLNSNITENGKTIYTNEDGKTKEVFPGLNDKEQRADKRQPWNQPSFAKNYPFKSESSRDKIRAYSVRALAWVQTNEGNFTVDKDGIYRLNKASGGHITGPGSGTSDSIPAMLSNGEYVIRANAVKKIGVNTLDKLNQADRLGFAAGGMVRKFKGGGYNGYANGGMVACPCGTPGCPGCAKGYAMGGMVRKYKDGGIVESLFGNTQNWFNNVISSMFGSGGNPSTALNATASDMIKTGAKNTIQGYKDFVFDPTDPVDYGFAALPGLKPAKTIAKKSADALGFPLILKPKVKTPGLAKFTRASSLGATPGGMKKIDGEDYYVKQPGGMPEVLGELMGSTLWNKLGLGGPKLQMLSPSLVASKIIPNLTDSDALSMSKFIDSAPNKVDGANKLLSGLKDYVKNQVPVNGLIGNFDSHSGNIMLDSKTGKFHNIDLGITTLTSHSGAEAQYLMAQDLAKRMKSISEGMKHSGFNARQINDFFKKNGFSAIDEETINNPYGPKGFSSFYFEKTRTKERNVSKEINSVSKMMGFDLSKPITSKANAAAVSGKSNKFIQDMIKQNPELGEWLVKEPYSSLTDWRINGSLKTMFLHLQEAAKDPIFKYANGGLVGYEKGGEVKKPKETRRRLVIDSNTINMAATDPAAPWNKGNWALNSKDPDQRKRTWQTYGWKPSYIKEGEPTSGEVMNVAKQMAYVLPGIGAGTLVGDSATAFGKGDIAGGILNAAMAPAGIFGPALAALKPVQSFFGAFMKPVAAVAKPLIKIVTPAVQAANRAAIRTAFRLGNVGIEQGSRSAATYVPSFMKSSMVLENNLPEINTNLKSIDYNKYIKPRHPNANLYATNLLRERYGSDYPLVHFNSNPGAVSKRVKPQKTSFLETMAKIAKDKVIKPVRTVARDATTLAAAKRFGLQTRSLPPLINPGQGTTPSLQAAKAMLPKMRIGKDNKLEMNAANSDYELQEMYDAENHWEIPEELLVALQGTIVNTKAALYRDRKVGSVSGNIFDANKGLTAQDIFVQLEEAYRGKGIAQRFTTQFIELLKNMGVKNIDIDAAMTDGGYAWARANFKFSGRPTNIIQRMETLRPLINNKKFDKLLERLKTADTEDLPMPKEILGLKTNWRRYFSEEKLIKQITTKYSRAAVSKDVTINTNTNSLGELIMRGSKWQGSKELGGGQKLKKTIDVFAGSVSAFPKTIGAIGSKAINSIGSLPKNMVEKFKAAKQVKENRKVESVFNEAVKRMEVERGREFTPEEIKSMGILPGIRAEMARQQGFNKVIKNPAIMTRRSVDSVINMLRTNKTKTLFDTGHSRGSDDILMRKQLENEYLGMGPESEGLIYGYLVQKGLLKRPLLRPQKPTKVDGGTDFYNPFSQMTAHYGPVGIVMKNSSLRGASITKGDSLNTYLALGTTVPVPFKGKKTASPFDPLQASRTIDRLPEYMEAQFLRYSPREDIESLYVQNKEHLKQLRAVVKELGLKIPVRMYNKKPVVQDFLETVKNARKERIRQRDEQDAIANFANGGMVRGYNIGGLVSGTMARAEPIPRQFAMGGMVSRKFAMGGYAMGTDTVPAMLTPGEFVIKKSAVDRIGTSTLNKINRYAEGGVVGSSTTTSVGDSVYNYSVNVNVATDSDPNQIARAVMSQIRKVDDHRVRGSSI
jgi:TP901 family phage tail tape measure protein